MSQAQQVLSPSLFAVLIEQAASGKVKTANLVSNVMSGIPVTYKEHSAAFTKERPGEYVVTLYKNAQEVGKSFCVTPVEAKLEVLDYVISMAREEAKAPPVQS